MKKLIALLVVAVPLVITNQAKAEAFTLPTLETSTTNSVFDTLASSFSFRTIEPASDLGAKWGFYLAAGVSGTDASTVSNLFGDMPTAYVPGADLMLGIGLPKGITAHVGIIPSLAYDGTTFQKWGGALQWTLTRSMFPKIPVSIAVQGLYSNSSLTYSQAVTGGEVAVSYGSSVYGGKLLVSKWLGAFSFGLEPWVGVGFVAHSSTLGAVGTGNLFGTSFPAGTQNISGSGSGLTYEAGLMIKLGVIGIAAEYAHLFGLNSFAGKVSLRI